MSALQLTKESPARRPSTADIVLTPILSLMRFVAVGSWFSYGTFSTVAHLRSLASTTARR